MCGNNKRKFEKLNDVVSKMKSYNLKMGLKGDCRKMLAKNIKSEERIFVIVLKTKLMKNLNVWRKDGERRSCENFYKKRLLISR